MQDDYKKTGASRDGQDADARRRRGGAHEGAFAARAVLRARQALQSHVLAPGCSIGYHEHQGESETFYILAGEARYNDNGTEVTLSPGDCAHTASGQGHSIANAGETPLEFIALIVNS